MPSNNSYAPIVDKFINTKEFSYLATIFETNGTYTNIPKGTIEYKKFWEDVRDKCLYGFENSVGQMITGQHFFYLNFCRILRKEKGRKTIGFPRFVDLDYDWFWMVQYAKLNQKNISCVKGRRQGYSYKAAAIVTHEYNFYRASRNIIGAFLSNYSEGTMDFVLDNCNFLNTYTEFKKQRNPDTKAYFKASYQVNIGGVKVWKGYMSDVECMTFKDKPTAAVGKCLGKGTKIIMFDGSLKNVEDVIVGDILLGPDSNERIVLSTTSGNDIMYKIKQKRGNDYIVNSEHILYLEERGYNKNKKVLITPKDFLNQPLSRQKRLYGLKSKKIEFENNKFIILDPYFLGLWLGDGSAGKTEITNMDEEVIEYIKAYSKFLKLDIRINTKPDCKAISISLNSKFGSKGKNIVRNQLKELGIFNNKRIPKIYLDSHESDRRHLLAGIIDTDGYKVRNNIYEVVTVSKELSEDILYLCRSLGLNATTRLKPKVNCYRIFISGNMSEIPILIKRKQSDINKLSTNHLITPIEVEEIGREEYYGFTLDKDHLFLLEDFTITHNSATWLVLDECGIFPNIIQAYGYSEPLIKDGNEYTGCCLMFGSAGSMEGGSQHFYDIFINPSQYNCLEFPDPDNEQKKIGYFSSAARGRWGKCKDPKSIYFGIDMVDDEGNSNELCAIDDILFARENAKGTSSASKLHETITQFPLTYKEAFMRSKGNIFSSTEMHEWLAKLETTPHLRDEAQTGEIIFDTEGKIKWRGDPTMNQIVDFPLKPEDPRQGCITIWEHPDMDTNQIPFGLYLAGCDPYDQDQSESGSLGSIFIYKRFYRADKIHNVIVAEYTGRPDFAEEFYENSRRLCIYYNAKCLYENQLKGLKAYFEQKNCTHYLYEQPQILKDIIKNSKVSRGYGIHMTKEVKDQLELYLRKWLYEIREIDGKTLFNMHTIKSIPLLKELIAYDRELNTDRVIALMCCILQTHELHKIITDSEINKPLFDTEQFFNKPLFVKNTSGKVRY